jgi:hypothetical protein
MHGDQDPEFRPLNGLSRPRENEYINIILFFKYEIALGT